jgi:hypothetical protein
LNKSPNPLSETIQSQIGPLFTEIDMVSGSLFIDSDHCCGIDDEGLAATNVECAELRVMFRMDATCDLRKDLVQQLIRWLKKCAADIDIACVGIEGLTDSRDLQTICALVNGTINLPSKEAMVPA